MTDTTSELQDNLDRILTGRQELIELGILPHPQTDGCAEAVAYPGGIKLPEEIQVYSLSYLNDELQRSVQAMAERAAWSHHHQKQADRRRWAQQEELERFRRAVEWLAKRYLPESALLDNPEDRLVREMTHFLLTGQEWTPGDSPAEASPVPPAARPDYTGLTVREAVFQALGAASVAWQPRPSNEVFDASQAEAIGEALLARLELEMVPPNRWHTNLVDGEEQL